jgi:hypothetical protein
VRTNTTQKRALTTYMHSKIQAIKHHMTRIKVMPKTGNYKVSMEESESEFLEKEERKIKMRIKTKNEVSDQHNDIKKEEESDLDNLF